MHYELRLPDLDLPGVPVTASIWHVRRGQAVVAGDRLLEVAAGCVTVDLCAPASGTLRARHVAEDDLLEPGQLLATIEGERECGMN